MNITPVLINERKRWQELYGLEITDKEEEEYNDVVRLASSICNVPVSFITLAELDNWWCQAQVGLDKQDLFSDKLFYAYTIDAENDFFEIPDILIDERFSGHPLVKKEPFLKFYAGTPIITSNGHKLGTLSIGDIKPNRLNEEQVNALKTLSRHLAKIIQLRLLNTRLKDQNASLNEETELQKLLLSVVAQDVRNPIGAIKGVMDFIGNNIVSEEDRNKLISMFSARLDSTLDIMNDLAEWNKIQSPDEKNRQETVHLKSFSSDILRHFKGNAELKNNRFSNLIDNELYIEAEPGLLRFILRNLVSNANNFTENGTITLYVMNEKDSFVFSVSDTGQGMSQERADKLLYLPKWSGSHGIKRERGYGLGLLLTKKLIDTLNGKMEIQSREGEGTTVFIHFKK